MQNLIDAFTMLLAKIAASVAWFGKLFVAVFVALWDIGKDGVCWVVEEFMKLAVTTLQALDVSAISSNLGVWGSIPGNVMEVLSALGLGQAFTVIVAAIGVRMVLQLIPFTRLGS